MEMGDLSDTIKSLFKCRKIIIDNNIFRLHYKLTVILLMIFSFLVTSKQYFGDPIDCDSGGKVDKYYMDTYCWIYSTFTIKKHLKGQQGIHNVAPGVGASRIVRISDNNADIIKHKYYQWVFVVLLLQALFFYIPRYLWKNWEGGRMHMLIQEFELGSPLVSNSWSDNTKEAMTKYLLTNQYVHNIYALRYIVCEIYNLINVILQIFIVDWFLGGQFTGIGISVFTFKNGTNESNPISHVFPKIAKCTYENFGPSGTIQLIDAICVLPLNVVNEKMYVVLWFWFIILALVSFLGLIYRALTVSNKTIRSYLLMAQVRALNKRRADIIINKLSWGDWFVLYQMNKNMDPVVFEELVLSLEHKINGAPKLNYVLKTTA